MLLSSELYKVAIHLSSRILLHLILTQTQIFIHNNNQNIEEVSTDLLWFVGMSSVRSTENDYHPRPNNTELDSLYAYCSTSVYCSLRDVKQQCTFIALHFYVNIIHKRENRLTT